MINLAKTKALCVLGANGKPIGMQKYYTDVLDKAVMQVSTGATDFHTAMRDSIIELGGSGVRVDYGGGVTRRLDTVVRQNLLWGAKQASVEYNEMIGEELGCDGYEVDWHSNPRPSHEFMQGKQFVVGKARTINGVHFDSFDEANERLQDYGCLHYKTPIICGISEPRYSPEELKRLNEQNAKKYTIDGKEYSGYEVTQMQRRLESAVRNEKTTRDLAKASGDNALVKRCNERIKAYQGKYNEISEITGIQGDKKRMSIPKGTASVKSATPTKTVIEKPKTISSDDIKKQISEIDRQMDELPFDKDWLSKSAELEKKRSDAQERLDEMLKKESKERVLEIESEFRKKGYFVTKGKGAHSSTDIELCDEVGAKAISDSADIVFEKYPQLKGKLAGISVRNDGFPTNALGETNGFSGITMNPNYFSNSSKLISDMSKSGSVGFNAVADIRGSVVHEFGHAVDVYLSKGGDVFAGGAEWKSISAKIQRETLSSLGLPKEAIEKGVSKYATCSSQEFFAECFSEYTLSPSPRPIAKKFGEILERELSKIK
jgi:hypothetical protein